MNKYTKCYVAEIEDTASVDVLAFSCMEQLLFFKEVEKSRPSKNIINIITSNNHELEKCVRSHGVQTEASQLAGLHSASGIERSRMKSRRVDNQVQDNAQNLKSHTIQKEAT